MPDISMRELAAIAANFGHGRPTVAQSRRGWFGTCGCGFRSVRCPEQQQAEQLVGEHVIRKAREIVARQKASGQLAG